MIYSGTVSAAMEGRYLGLPAIAVSLARPRERHDGAGHHFDSAARAVLLLARRLRTRLPSFLWPTAREG